MVKSYHCILLSELTGWNKGRSPPSAGLDCNSGDRAQRSSQRIFWTKFPSQRDVVPVHEEAIVLLGKNVGEICEP